MASLPQLKRLQKSKAYQETMDGLTADLRFSFLSLNPASPTFATEAAAIVGGLATLRTLGGHLERVIESLEAASRKGREPEVVDEEEIQ